MSDPSPPRLLPMLAGGSGAIDTLAQHVQVLTLENHALRRSAGHDATIVPLPDAGP